MAEPAIRVLIRWTLGQPFAQNREAAEASTNKDGARITEKWKSPGIKEIGSWHGSLDGFGHYAIYEIDDIATAWQMQQDWWEAES